jgi:hypothetical protein
MDSRPPSAESTITLGNVFTSVVLPAPAWPYTNNFTPLADKLPVDFKLIAIWLSFFTHFRKSVLGVLALYHTIWGKIRTAQQINLTKEKEHDDT